MVGRLPELNAMSDAYARVLAGQSQVMLLTGEAGVGKTRLVEELSARVQSPDGGARVLIGASVPLAGAALAYGPFVAALGDEAPWLLADDSTGDVLTARHRLFVRVLKLLAGLAARSPVLVVLEDLHWADVSSRELLAFLTVRLRAEMVMLVGTLREAELAGGGRRWLAELECSSRMIRLRLGRLADAEITRLVAELLSADASPDWVAGVVAAADGNPLYARELAIAGPGSSPALIADAVLARAAALTATARAVINQVCVADGGMSHELLATVVRLAPERLLTAARRAVSSGLLVAVGSGYAFGHELIRQVLYAELLPGERQHLHRRLAEALAARPGVAPGSLAQQWYLADCPDRAAPVAVTAARAAVSARAYPEAVRCYALSLQLGAWLPESRHVLLEEAAQAASWAGEPERAVAWATEAISQPGVADRVGRARMLERLGRYQWEAGDLRAAVDATGQAIGLLEDSPPSALRARVLAAYATLRMLLTDFDAALPLATRAVAAAEEAGAAAEHAHGLATLGIIQAHRGDLEAGLATLRTSSGLARRARSIEAVVRAATNHVYVLCTAGRFAEALAVARDGREAADWLGIPAALTSMLDHNTAGVLIFTGQWTEAERLLAGIAGQSSGHATTCLRLDRLELAVGRGEDQRAADLAAAVDKRAEGSRILGPLHACLAEHALHSNNLAIAAAEVLAGLTALAGTSLPAEEIRLLAAGARVAADLASLPGPARPAGLPDQWARAAETFADRALAITEPHSGKQHEVAAFGVLVAAERARENGTDSRATWRAAADAWRLAGAPYREAYARLREAEAAVRAGRRDQAGRALDACRALAGTLTAAPLLTLAGELAERARLTVRPTTDLFAVAHAPFDLTGRQKQVLALLARGSSNRQIARALFISERTVAVHVSRILAKLGVRNRTEATIASARLGLTLAESGPARPGPAE
jgi:DNA-binding CsgD family transcriptional regulator